MNPSWKKFLDRSGAAIDDGGVMHFGDPLAEERAAFGAGVVCDLSHRGLIAVNGEDAFTFLQGQLTCDLKAVTPARSRLAAWCNPKGRVLMLFRVVREDEGFLLELPASQIEAAIGRLKMYVLRARVSLSDVSDEFVAAGLAGKGATEVIKTRFGSAPQSPDEVAGAGDSRILRLQGSAPRYQYLGNANGAEALWREAAKSLTPAGRRVWSLLEILAGVPEVMQADEHLPQMINLDLLGGVSFEKGCYVGQEIIARTHYLGRLKRRMYLVAASDGDAPPSGAPVIDAAADVEVGQIVSSAPRGDADGFAALAVLRMDAAESGTLHLGSAGGPRIELLELPYSVAHQRG